MISAWARMCKILGKEFQQYLPVVMGPLMKTASIKPEVALLDSEFLHLHHLLTLCKKQHKPPNVYFSITSPRYGKHE